MQAVLISVSKAMGRQCVADASPAIWDHTCHPIQVNPSVLYIWEEGQTSAVHI